MRTGLQIHLLTTFPSPTGDGQPLLCRQVDHPGRTAGQIGSVHKPSHPVCFHQIGPGNGVIPGTNLPLRLQLLHPGLEDIVVLTMDTDDTVLTGQMLDGFVHDPVAQAHIVVHHVHLEGGDAVLDHERQLGDPRLVPLGHGHMEAVIAAAVFRLVLPLAESLHQGHAPFLGGKVQHGGGTAHQGGLGAGDKIVRRDGAAHLQIEMGMRVDEPGEHIAARSVNDPVAGGVYGAPHLDDLSPIRQQIAPFHPVLKNKRSVFDQYPHMYILLYVYQVYHSGDQKRTSFKKIIWPSSNFLISVVYF